MEEKLVKKSFWLKKSQAKLIEKISREQKCSESHFIRTALDEKIIKLTTKT